MQPKTSSPRRTTQPTARSYRGPVVTAGCLGGVGLCVWLLMASARSPAMTAEPEAPTAEATAPVADQLPMPGVLSQPAASPPPSPAPAKVAEPSVAAPAPAAPPVQPPAAAPAAKPPSVLGQLELQVSDASRQPLTDGRVFVALTAEAGTAEARTWRGLSSFKSAAIEAGKVEIRGLAAGEYSYMLTGRGVQQKSGRVFVGAGKTTQLVTVERRQVPQGGQQRGQPGLQPGGQQQGGQQPGGQPGARGAGRGRGGRGGAANPGGAPGQPNPQGTNPGGANPEGEEAPRPARRRRG